MKSLKQILKWGLLSLGVGAAVLWAVPAQGATATHTVTFDNQTAIALTLDQSTYGFGTVNPNTASQSANNVVNATVKSNASWTLKVKGDANFISGANNIPIGRLSWASDNTNFTTMTTSDATVTTGAQTSDSGTTTGMEYKLALSYADPVASAYSATITYTATNP